MNSPAYSEFLTLHPPFDRFEPEAMAFLDSHLQSASVPAGRVLVSPELGEPQWLYIVAKGKVHAAEAGATGEPGEVDLTLSVGECFPIGALSGRRPPANVYAAATDLTLYQLPAADFHKLMASSPVFARHCNGYLSALVSQSRQQLQTRYSQQVSEQRSLNAPLHELIKCPPISVTSITPIRHAIEIMGKHKADSVIVVNADGAPIGVLTQSDVVFRVVLGQVPLEQPITDVMSHDPLTLPESANIYDAMFSMATRGVRHLLLVDDAGRLSGVISEHDLFVRQRIGVGQVRRAIERAEDVDMLKAAQRDVRQSVFSLLAQGVGAEQMTQFISTLNDAVTERVLQINLPRHTLDDIQWSWLAFGSEGREEQTLATDQDNGIVFLLPLDADLELTRARLLAFARDVNADLDQCGFPLCKGEIMASNPLWCLTLAEWKQRFSCWIDNPQPEALLNATIFFDFRVLHGRSDLAERMYEHLLSQSMANSVFQRMLAANALIVTPPLGVIRDFITETDENGRAFIDLKKYGARLFVDGARLLALANGINVASTVKRLRRTAKLSGGVGDDVEAMIDAFNFIQLLRLRHQHLEAGHGRPGDNRIYVEQLNQLDRRILKESFRQARKLQQRLKLNYQL
jgi:CBS domain-containing protein